MNNSGSCWQISFVPLKEVPPYFEEFLLDYFEVVTDNYGDDGTDSFVAYQRQPFDETHFRQAARQWNINLPAFGCDYLSSQNWLKDNIIRFDPVEAGKFLIYGIHEKQTPKTSKIPLCIYAATAFGSEHQTTKCCLLALSELYDRKFLPRQILDLGCGSGILSLAAAKLWPQQTVITAVDIDQEAVAVTAQNTRTNRLEHCVTAALSNGYQSEAVKKSAPYDLIFANILARPLVEMAADLSAHLAPGGFAILSGFIADQEDWVIEAHRQYGLDLLKIFEMDNWRAALMEKKS